jgi:hypothetical protein
VTKGNKLLEKDSKADLAFEGGNESRRKRIKLRASAIVQRLLDDWYRLKAP